MQEIIWNNFRNYGFLSHKFTDEQLQPIKKEIDEIKNNFINAIPHNHKLAGNIESEYVLTKSRSYISELLAPFVTLYDRTYNYNSNINVLEFDVNIELYEPWVNFQKKGEFNPVHNHKGIYSFVLWIDIPYDIKDELALPLTINSNCKAPGHFQFIYNDILGGIKTHAVPADRSFNNTIYFFPAALSHTVYPFFTSDDYRISVSGNYILKP